MILIATTRKLDYLRSISGDDLGHIASLLVEVKEDGSAYAHKDPEGNSGPFDLTTLPAQLQAQIATMP